MKMKIFDDFSVSPLPRVVRIEPASLCNLRCIHCPTGTRKTLKRGVMDWAVFSQIKRQISAYKGVDVVVLYHGGEPFLNKNILRMVKAFKSENMRFVKIVTNGMLIADRMLKKIITSGLDSIEFSLDGRSPQENNRIRRGSDYHKVASTIKALLEMKAGLGAANPEVFVANTQISSASAIKNGRILTPGFIKDTFSDFKGRVGYKNTYMLKWPGLKISKKYHLVKRSSDSGANGAKCCDHTLETITIRHNGDVVPCCYDLTNRYVIGNITKEPLGKLWNNKKYRTLRRRIFNRDYPFLCRHCNVIYPGTYLAKK